MSPLRVALVVQGEGRGHMTQALALARFLHEAGHEVARVFVGASPHRSVPRYFLEGVEAPVTEFAAPTQVPGPDGRGVSVLATARDAARRLPDFVRGGAAIHEATARLDVVVNLLDLVGGLSRVVFRTPAPALAVAHNYLFAHPDLAAAPGSAVARALLRLYIGGTALRVHERVALSFVPMSVPPGSGLRVAPPLLRPGLERLDEHDGGHLLAYALNAGYGDRLARWQRERPEVRVHCYVDGGTDALREEPGPGFHAHELDQEAFLRHLAGCRAYVGSAGFESLCEAYWLGKPTLAVPTAGQLEQAWNAWDAERCGVARRGGYHDLDTFWEGARPPEAAAVQAFRAWVARAPALLVDAVERAAARSRERVGP